MLYADDPTAPEANGETDDLRNEELLPPTGRFVIVYDDEGEPIACGAIRRRDDETAEIKRMYVRPAARGRGLSRLVLRELEATAIAPGLPRARPRDRARASPRRSRSTSRPGTRSSRTSASTRSPR